MVKAGHGPHNDELSACRQDPAEAAKNGHPRAAGARSKVNCTLTIPPHCSLCADEALFKKADSIMRTLLSAALWICLVTAAQAAERRMFIIANDADGYGVDRCLATGDKCGAVAANAYCKTRQFAQAATFHKVDRNDITGAIPTGGSGGCRGPNCEVVAIVCTR